MFFMCRPTRKSERITISLYISCYNVHMMYQIEFKNVEHNNLPPPKVRRISRELISLKPLRVILKQQLLVYFIFFK